MTLDSEAIITQLAMRLAQMEVDLAVARSQIPEPEEEEGGVTILEVIDGGKGKDDADDS